MHDDLTANRSLVVVVVVVVVAVVVVIVVSDRHDLDH